MDIASLLGVILGIGMVLFGIIQNGGVGALINFLDAPSAIITIGGLGLTLGYVLKKNRELTGVIKNQQLTIDGLMKEVKNLSYHLGKKTIINK